jgi:hypothetical protein
MPPIAAWDGALPALRLPFIGEKEKRSEGWPGTQFNRVRSVV